MDTRPKLVEVFILKNLLKICLLYKKMIIAFVISFCVVVGLYSYIVVPYEYEATTSIMPIDEAGSGGGLSSMLQNFSGLAAMGGVGQSQKNQQIADMVKSKEVAKYIVNKCQIRKYPQFSGANNDDLYKFLEENFEVTVQKTGFTYIFFSLATTKFPSAKDKQETAKLVADITNAAVAAIDSINRNKSTSKARKKRIFIERVLVDNKLKLDSIDKTLEAFQKQHKVLAIDEQTKAILANAVDIGAELSKAEIEMNLIMQDYDANSPKVKAYQKQLADLRGQYRRIQSGGITGNDDFSLNLKEVPELIRQYTNLLRSQKVLVQIIAYLETQKYQEAIQEESDVSIVEQLDKAEPPLKKSSPSHFLTLLLAFIVSSIFSIFAVAVYSYRKGQLSTFVPIEKE